MYYKALRGQKKSQWEDFPEDAENFWQASRYKTDQDTKASLSPIPTLQKSETVSVHKDIAKVLLQTFFPPHPEYEAPKKLNLSDYRQLTMQEVTEKEVQEAIFRVSPFKGARIDVIPTVVWQKLSRSSKEL